MKVIKGMHEGAMTREKSLCWETNKLSVGFASRFSVEPSPALDGEWCCGSGRNPGWNETTTGRVKNSAGRISD